MPHKTRLFVSLFAAMMAGKSFAGTSVNSSITAATVYLDRAVLTRTAAVELEAGEQQLVFARLPDGLDDDSLHVAGSGTAQVTILDVASNEEWTEKPSDDRVRALEDSLKDLQRQLKALEDHAAILAQQKALIVRMADEAAKPTPGGRDAPPASRLSPIDMQQVVEFYRSSSDKLSLELQGVDVDRQTLNDKIAAATARLDQVKGPDSKAVKSVTVRLNVVHAGHLDLSLSYELQGAQWRPVYEARLSTAEHKLTVGYSGIVSQNTDEDWKGVALTLSTAHPSVGGAAPELTPWFIAKAFDRYTGTLAGNRIRTDLKAEAATRAIEADEPTVLSPFEVSNASAQVGAAATSATFRVSGSTDIPSDNEPHKVGIAQIPLAAELAYVATPKLMPAAFLSASVTNNSDYPIIAGEMGVFLDDVYVAKTRVKTVMPGEKFDLSLGVDDGIKVERKLINRFVEDLGIITKQSRVTYDILITVTNNRREPAKISVKDQIPVSRHEKAEVVQLEPSVDELKPDAQGILTWKLDLKPGEKKELPLKFSVTYPNDLQLSGLE